MTVGHGCWERGESKIQHGIAGPLDVSPKRSHGTFNEKTSTLLVMVTSWTPMLSCWLIENHVKHPIFFALHPPMSGKRKEERYMAEAFELGSGTPSEHFSREIVCCQW